MERRVACDIRSLTSESGESFVRRKLGAVTEANREPHRRGRVEVRRTPLRLSGAVAKGAS
jgi:hypothetical protein